MKIDQFSLFLQRIVENEDDLPSLPAQAFSKPNLRSDRAKWKWRTWMIVKLNWIAKLPHPNPASLVNIWPAGGGGQDEHQGEAGHDLWQVDVYSFSVMKGWALWNSNSICE